MVTCTIEVAKRMGRYDILSQYSILELDVHKRRGDLLPTIVSALPESCSLRSPYHLLYASSQHPQSTLVKVKENGTCRSVSNRVSRAALE